MARPVQEINAGSMADIAFLLLIFFLVTTTMDVDTGIVRRLPPFTPPTEENIEINERNVFVVLVNSNDQLLVENQLGDINTLRSATIEFLKNPSKAGNLSEYKLTSEFLEEAKAANKEDVIEKLTLAMELFGDYPVSKGVISLQNDRGTSYGTYIKVQNELASAINQVRDELCKSKLGISYAKLVESKDEAKLNALKEIIPMQISEAEPKDVGGNK